MKDFEARYVIPVDIVVMAANGNTKPLEVILSLKGCDLSKSSVMIAAVSKKFTFGVYQKNTRLVPNEKWIIYKKISIYFSDQTIELLGQKNLNAHKKDTV